MKSIKVFLLALITFSFAWLLPGFVLSDSELPEIGDPSGRILSPLKEQEIGARLLRHLRSQKLILDDPLVRHYIEDLGYKLVEHSDQADRRFEFFIVNDQSINAFAAPGGYIGIHTGLMDIAHNESELAAVLSHEIAHVTQNHLARLFEASQRQHWVTAVSLLAALLVGDKELRNAALASSIAAGQQLQINFTRGNEQEADRVGIKILTDAGFDASSMPKFFQRLQSASSLHGTRMPDFLNTHPVTSARIAESMSYVPKNPPKKPIDNPNFYYMRARIKILNQRQPERLVNYFRTQLNTGYSLNKKAVQYGLVLALTHARRYDEAHTYLDPLLKNDPTRLALIVADAEIQLGKRNTQQVIEIYDTARVLFPNNEALVFYYSNALLELNQSKRAYKLLQEYLLQNKKRVNAHFHFNYAQAAARTGSLAEAYQHKAEHFYLNGHTKAAIEQLTQAAALKNLDYHLGSIIESRLQELKAEYLSAQGKKDHGG